MGFGTELPLLLALGFVVLGPKRMHATLRHVAQVKREFDKAICSIKSQFPAEDKDAPQEGGSDDQNNKFRKIYHGPAVPITADGKLQTESIPCGSRET